MSNNWQCSHVFPCGTPSSLGDEASGPLTDYPLQWTQLQAQEIEWTWKELLMSLSGTITMQSPPEGAGNFSSYDLETMSASAVADADSTTWADLLRLHYGATRRWELSATQEIAVTIPSDYGGGPGTVIVQATADFQALRYVHGTINPRQFVKLLNMSVLASCFLPTGFTSFAGITTTPGGTGTSISGVWKAFGNDVAYHNFSAGSYPLGIDVPEFVLSDSGARLTAPTPIG
ncbi:MAG TPA: hypothetical protein VK961_24765 [Chthoniobacter sp.]|nr:hypothetical protein [Chthoniobacter sp.]